MVDAHNVKKLSAVADPVQPELIVLLLHVVPVVDGIAPSLSCLAEIVRRNACYEDGTSVRVQKEIVLSSPHIHRVHAHVEGHIPHDTDTVFVGRFFHLHPLAEEHILKEHLEIRLFLFRGSQLPAGLGPVFILLFPLIPACAAVASLKGAEHAVLPGPLLPGKGPELFLLVQPLLPECLPGLLKIGKLESAHRIVIHPDCLFPEHLRLLFQKSLLEKHIQTDIQLISCVG